MSLELKMTDNCRKTSKIKDLLNEVQWFDRVSGNMRFF